MHEYMSQISLTSFCSLFRNVKDVSDSQDLVMAWTRLNLRPDSSIWELMRFVSSTAWPNFTETFPEILSLNRRLVILGVLARESEYTTVLIFNLLSWSIDSHLNPALAKTSLNRLSKLKSELNLYIGIKAWICLTHWVRNSTVSIITAE